MQYCMLIAQLLTSDPFPLSACALQLLYLTRKTKNVGLITIHLTMSTVPNVMVTLLVPLRFSNVRIIRYGQEEKSDCCDEKFPFPILQRRAKYEDHQMPIKARVITIDIIVAFGVVLLGFLIQQTLHLTDICKHLL